MRCTRTGHHYCCAPYLQCLCTVLQAQPKEQQHTLTPPWPCSPPCRRQVAQELLGGVYRTWFEACFLRDFVVHRAFMYQGVGVDEVFKIAQREGEGGHQQRKVHVSALSCNGADHVEQPDQHGGWIPLDEQQVC
jgi:hypothetical protein